MKKIKIGRVTGAQGLRGELKLYHDSGDEEALRRLSSVFLRDGGGDKATRIENLRMQNKTPILKLEGVSDRNAAEGLVGSEVYADESESRPGEGDGWLVSDLVGLEVRIVDAVGGRPGTVAPTGGDVDGAVDCAADGAENHGKEVYRIKDVISNPAHDILEIDTGNGIRMLPLVDVFVLDVNVEKGIITIIPPTNWLE